MTESAKLVISEPQRPVPLEGYGVPESKEGLLSWDFVREAMQPAKNYWIVTVSTDGKPHTRPTWGVWLDDRLHFGGSPDTRWSRNLEKNPQVTAHLESAWDGVVIIEGTVTRITDASDPRMARIDEAYVAKYQMPHGVPIWVLEPQKVIAWKEYPVSVTRWVF
jgi:nitroimidazol reductase NimA-like FMN-containing flavoprotein (pyridoxamine 5'-phosphate oxidase superfamily)